ncbi:MAG: hypothetical protein ACPGVG_16140, partial [Mycobacterium sp.]
AAIAAVLVIIRRLSDRTPSPRIQRQWRESSRRLIVAGVRDSGLRQRLALRGPTIMNAAQSAADQIRFLSRARIDGDLMSARLERLARQLTESDEARRTKADRQADEKRLKDLRRRRQDLEGEQTRRDLTADERKELSDAISEERQAETYRKARDKRWGHLTANDRDEWLDAVRSTLRDRGNALTNAIVDAWAYRQYSVGVMLSTKAAGVQFMVAFNNPPSGPDVRTTSFCRWVHGRPVKLSTAISRFSRHEQAVREGDRDAAIRSTPFVGRREFKAADEAEGDAKKLSFVPHPRANDDSYRTVWVDVSKIDSEFSKESTYIGPNDVGIGGRRDEFKRFLRTGEPIQQSLGIVDANGNFDGFVDGRHRFAVLRDAGHKAVPISFDFFGETGSVDDRVHRFRQRFGAAPQDRRDRPRRVSDQAMREFFGGGRIPPYHWRCRTILRPAPRGMFSPADLRLPNGLIPVAAA